MGMWLCLLGCLALSVSVRGLDCTGSERPYPPNNCLTFFSEDRLSHSSANTGCELVTIIDSEQFITLARYVEVLPVPQSQTLYWTGYRYNASNTLVGPDNTEVPSESPVLVFGNYAAQFPLPPEVEGVCLAIGHYGANEVKFFRMNCSQQLGYVCSESVNAPTVSLSASASRFLAQGSSITLTCSTTNTDSSVQWRRNNMVVTTDTLRVTVASDTLTVDSFDGVRAGYECVAGNRAGGVVSQAVVLDLSGGIESTAPTITELSASSSSVQFGTGVNLTCSFTATNTLYSVEWFVNGNLQRSTALSGNETQDVFVVNSFSEDGVYQCRVFNENRDNSVEGIFISGIAGTPGLVQFPISLADTQSQVFISWFPPVNLNVLDPLLLRYELYYHRGTSFNVSTATLVPDIPPLLLNGVVSPQGVVETTVSGLQPGTTYIMTVRAVSSVGSGELRGDRVIVTTFGNIPTVSVDDSLKAQRTKDNKTLFANWDDIKTIPPVGGLARYWVDYRDSNKDGSINSVILEPKYSYLVVSPVEDAQNYQVRVRLGVITKREPLTYSYGPFSKWVEVQGIVDEVPPAPPGVTPGPLRPAGVIAAAVVVPVCVVALIVLIFVVGMVCCCIKGPGRSGSYRPKKHERSQAIGLQSQDSTARLQLPEKEPSPDSS